MIVIADGSSKSILNDSFAYTFVSMLCVIPAILVWFLIAFAFNKQIINAMTKSKGLERKDNPKIYNIVENLCISRGLPVPTIQIIEDDSLNAFASGLSPKDSAITFSRGILNKLSDQEIEAVAAHELTHIINRDVRLMIVSIIFVGIIQTIADLIVRVNIRSNNNKDSGNLFLIILAIKIVAFILGFFISVIVQLTISRKREFLADAGSVELTKTSEYLISALTKISQDSQIEAVENRSVAQMFFDNPLSKKEKLNFIDKMFMTHPSIDERIAALRMVAS
jgi:heat shock protein HtpX